MNSRGNACCAGYFKRRTQCNQCTNTKQLKNRRFIRGPAYIKLTVVDRLIHCQVFFFTYFLDWLRGWAHIQQKTITANLALNQFRVS